MSALQAGGSLEITLTVPVLSDLLTVQDPIYFLMVGCPQLHIYAGYIESSTVDGNAECGHT